MEEKVLTELAELRGEVRAVAGLPGEVSRLREALALNTTACVKLATQLEALQPVDGKVLELQKEMVESRADRKDLHDEDARIYKRIDTAMATVGKLFWPIYGALVTLAVGGVWVWMLAEHRVGH